MSQPDESSALLPSPSFEMQSNFGEPSSQASAAAGPTASGSIETCVDQDFDFQIVVFKVLLSVFKYSYEEKLITIIPPKGRKYAF